MKNYDAGLFYFRRKAFDSAILYFKDVLTRYPNAPAVKQTSLKLVEAYRAIRYREDASDLCTQLRKRYVNDVGVKEACTGVPDAAPPPTTSAVP
jgi:outer membrane protein assembly factor BamD